MIEGALRHRFARIAMAASLSLCGGGLAAQEIPEGQSCGGLVCDLGLFGHKTAPKPAAAPAVVGVPVPPPQRADARPEPAQESKRAAVHKKARVAKVVTPKIATSKAVTPKAASRATASTEGFGAAPVAATLSPPPAASPRAAPPPPTSPVAAALSPPPSMMAPPAPPPIPVTATPSQPVVLANPYVYSRPLPFMFQSVDPTQSVQ